MPLKKPSSLAIKDILTHSPLPRLETEIILAQLMGRGRAFILAHPDKAVSRNINKKFEILAKKRLKNWPLAYLLGHQGFFNLDLLVNPRVLIPRPETELLAENLIAAARVAARPLAVIDLGTGSGAIIISLTKELWRSDKNFNKKGVEFFAVDISRAALQIAKQNAARCRCRQNIIFKQGDLLQPILKKLARKHLVIAANLPYLTPDQIKASPSISREPRLALDGGQDGLKYYRRLFQQLAKLPCLSATVWLEIDPGQKIIIRKLAKRYLSGAAVVIKRDLRKKARFGELRWRPIDKF